MNQEKNNFPFVSIIIPCRNEKKYIGKCLDSIINQDYPKNRIEVLIVDGMSEDKTREIIREYCKDNPFIILLENPDKITPKGMNVGVRNSKGDIIVLPVNAHAILDKEFLKWNIFYLNEIKDADAVGGTLRTINENRGIISQAIPLAADSFFGLGGKRYRNRQDEGFINDTTPYTAYRREVFGKIGYIDEGLIRDQDEELNYRLLKSGGKIYFSPKIKSQLYIRPTVSKLWKQHFQYGYWKVKVGQKVGFKMIKKQLVPAIFAGSLLFSLAFSPFSRLARILFSLILGSYFLVALFFSLFISLRKNLIYFVFLPIIYFILHFSYGIGFLKGLTNFNILKRDKIKDVSLTR